jgi:hypothetical protein
MITTGRVPHPNHPARATNEATGQRKHGKQPPWRSCHSPDFSFYYAWWQGRSGFPGNPAALDLTNPASVLGGGASPG